MSAFMVTSIDRNVNWGNHEGPNSHLFSRRQQLLVEQTLGHGTA